MADYPATLPCANWEYAQNIEPFENRTAYDCGWVRQRKRYDSNLTGLQLSFTMSTFQFYEWQAWIDSNGYNTWFNINLDDYGSGQELTSIRITGATQYNYITWDTVNVSVSAEVEQ